MLCPVCKQDMIVIEHRSIELDYCTKCEGVWFDSGELELLLHTEKLESAAISPHNLLNAGETRPSQQGRKCPVCRRRMKEVAVGKPAIDIDACPRGDGLWFDGGEVDQLLAQLAGRQVSKENAPSPVISFLGEMFRMKK